jgi:Putative prokaryotic signal transducing protein
MADETPKQDPGAQLVEVHRAANSIAAHFFKNALEDAGITAYITGEAMSVTESFPMWWSSPRILVDAADAERAAAIIRDLESARKERHARDGK